MTVLPREVLSGRFKWRLKLPDQYVPTRPIVGPDGAVYAMGNFGHIYAVNSDGSIRWVVSPAGGVSGCLGMLPNGNLVVGGGGGVQALSFVDGSTLWTFPLQTPLLAGPSVGPDGNIYAADDSRWSQIGHRGVHSFARRATYLEWRQILSARRWLDAAGGQVWRRQRLFLVRLQFDRRSGRARRIKRASPRRWLVLAGGGWRWHPSGRDPERQCRALSSFEHRDAQSKWRDDLVPEFGTLRWPTASRSRGRVGWHNLFHDHQRPTSCDFADRTDSCIRR